MCYCQHSLTLNEKPFIAHSLNKKQSHCFAKFLSTIIAQPIAYILVLPCNTCPSFGLIVSRPSLDDPRLGCCFQGCGTVCLSEVMYLGLTENKFSVCNMVPFHSEQKKLSQSYLQSLSHTQGGFVNPATAGPFSPPIQPPPNPRLLSQVAASSPPLHTLSPSLRVT